PSYLRPATNPTTSGCSSAWALQPEPTRSASSIDASPDSSGIWDSPEPDFPESDWDSEFSDSEPPESEPMLEQPLSARSPMAPAEMTVAVRVRSWVFIVVLLDSGELVGTAVEVASRGCCVPGIRSRFRIGWVSARIHHRSFRRRRADVLIRPGTGCGGGRWRSSGSHPDASP